jgi:hypothetical protein
MKGPERIGVRDKPGRAPVRNLLNGTTWRHCNTKS